MKSNFYIQGHHKQVAKKIEEYINSLDGFLTPQTASSPRAVGDALESLVAERFETFLGDWCSKYFKEFGRRAMEDIAFVYMEGIYSAIDIKTHREGTDFNMPNLTSIRRLTQFYESDNNVFSLIVIRYSINGTDLEVSDVLFSPIELLDWDCLKVGSLGWGQIQIANSNNILIREQYSRREWMLQLCDVVMEFYPREIGKIRERIQRFEEVRATWEAKVDVWT